MRKNRNTSRLRDNNSRFSNVPDSEDLVKMAKELAINIPVLTLLRQNGEELQGWKNSPFWWPILMTPKNTKTVIFSSEINDN